jgi:hypothetical protein
MQAANWRSWWSGLIASATGRSTGPAAGKTWKAWSDCAAAGSLAARRRKCRASCRPRSQTSRTQRHRYKRSRSSVVSHALHLPPAILGRRQKFKRRQADVDSEQAGEFGTGTMPLAGITVPSPDRGCVRPKSSGRVLGKRAFALRTTRTDWRWQQDLGSAGSDLWFEENGNSW